MGATKIDDPFDEQGRGSVNITALFISVLIWALIGVGIMGLVG